jgi:phage major head subunit gpT-like protein
MAIVNSDFLAGVRTGFRSLFQTSFEAATKQSPWREMAMTIQSTGQVESYDWLGTVPVMVDVTDGDIQVEGLGHYSQSITNLTYKAAIEVTRAAMEDDKLNLVTPRVGQLGLEAARHPGQLIFALFESGGLAFDATAFFADTRVIGRSANIDNIVTGSYGNGTVAEFLAGLAAGRQQMRLYQDDQGRPMNHTPNIIVVPPALEQAAYQALSQTTQGASTVPVPATEDGAFRIANYLLLVNPYLTTTDDWYMFHSTAATKPFIYQERVAPSLEGLTTPETESGIVRDRFVYSVRARYAVGYGDPRYAVKVLDS